MVDDTNVTRLFSSRDLEELFRLEHPEPLTAVELQNYTPKLDTSAKDKIMGKNSAGDTVGVGDKVRRGNVDVNSA